VTEYGIAYLHGKNIRERAMELISIAHPAFRPWLMEEAKKRNVVYKDQAFIPGKRGEYPESLETSRTTRTGMEILLRPVKISDEPLLKDFFYSLSDQSLYRRFISVRKDMPHERLQEFVIIDYNKSTVILATVPEERKRRSSESDSMASTRRLTRQKSDSQSGMIVRARESDQNCSPTSRTLQRDRDFSVSSLRCSLKTGRCFTSFTRWGSTSNRGGRKGSTS